MSPPIQRSHRTSPALELSQQILEQSRVIAVVGARDRPHLAGFYVPQYLYEQGYIILPVNPSRVGQLLWGERVVATLHDLRLPADLVNLFRRPETLPEHVEEILGMSPRPKAVWMQQGIRHAQAAAVLRAAGMKVVEDRCTLADHRMLGMSAQRKA